MAERPSLNIAVAKKKNKASEYNQNFTLMMDYIDATLQECKDYVDGYMPSISSSTKNKYLSNNGSAASWVGMGNQPFSGYIDGLILTKNSDDTLNISAGSCYDTTKTTILALLSSTAKQNETQSASTTYYVYIIGDGTNIDFLITTSSSSPTLPSGYIYYRQIGYYTTDENNKVNLIYTFGSASSDPQISKVIDKYVNGTSWYIEYSDGRCEQGGLVGGGGTEHNISLLKSYKDTDYNITYGLGYTTTATALQGGNIYRGGITTSSFKIYLYGGAYYAYWRTTGYLA